MGRMLDALNRTPSQPPPAPPRPVPEEIPVVDAVECPAEPEEEAGVPFIEVGGSRSAIDGSPEVLAAPASRPVPVEPERKPVADEECLPVGMVSIWCSWTLRPGMKVSKEN